MRIQSFVETSVFKQVLKPEVVTYDCARLYNDLKKTCRSITWFGANLSPDRVLEVSSQLEALFGWRFIEFRVSTRGDRLASGGNSPTLLIKLLPGELGRSN